MSTQSSTPESVAITSRRPEFDFSNTPRIWLADPFKTHFMNALSVLIPYSERTVNEIMRKNFDAVNDPTLQGEILVLIKQEGNHAVIHKKSNDLLQQCHYPAIRFFEWLQKKSMLLIRKCSSHAFEMAIPASFEHFTSAISRDFLTHSKEWTGTQNNAAIDFVNWHSFEEIEHQAVCYDAYKALYKSQWRLVLSLLFFWMPMTVLSTYAVQLYFLHKDRVIYKPSNWLPYLKFIKQSIGLFTNGIFKYRHAEFKPWQTNDQVLYECHLAKHQPGLAK
ncbi:MAG: metal-dependent hydrolase [Hahellaceae bacterium]|nr:metal-dependent hydrolase [Hahellaceae bacterium]MCP5212641.1 metal-dependent hydrolase [Hahellaceae bacterium]